MRLEGGCHRTVAWTRHELGIFLFSRTRICTNPEVNTYIHIPKNDGYGSKGPMYISLASYQDMLPCTVSPEIATDFLDTLLIWVDVRGLISSQSV